MWDTGHEPWSLVSKLFALYNHPTSSFSYNFCPIQERPASSWIQAAIVFPLKCVRPSELVLYKSTALDRVFVLLHNIYCSRFYFTPCQLIRYTARYITVLLFPTKLVIVSFLLQIQPLHACLFVDDRLIAQHIFPHDRQHFIHHISSHKLH